MPELYHKYNHGYFHMCPMLFRNQFTTSYRSETQDSLSKTVNLGKSDISVIWGSQWGWD